MQDTNAPNPMDETLAGREILVNPESLKTLPPILSSKLPLANVTVFNYGLRKGEGKRCQGRKRRKWQKQEAMWKEKEVEVSEHFTTEEEVNAQEREEAISISSYLQASAA